MMMTVGLLTFSIIFISTVGFSGYLTGLVIIIPTILIGSALGIMLGSFFDNPMSAMGWVFIFMVLFGLPAVSLFAPVFSPGWLKVLPSYYTLMGLDAVIFPDNYSNVFWISVGVLTAITVLLVPLSGWMFNHKIRKEY
jgi:hypothetical protein